MRRIRHFASLLVLAVVAAGCAMENPNAIQADGTRANLTLTPVQFQAAYLLLISWMEQTNRNYASQARSVPSLGFTRLPKYFPADVLASAKVVTLDDLPLPALASMGLGGFTHFLQGDLDGITYLDTIYIKTSQKADPALLFHELVHVLQWRLLGPERFLALYAEGLARSGYRKSPLEDMAYRAQDRFKSSDRTFDADTFVQESLRATWPGIALNGAAGSSSGGGEKPPM